MRIMKLSPTNLSLPDTLVETAKQYVQCRKKIDRSFSLSELTTGLLLRYLRSKGVKLPQEFAVKTGGNEAAESRPSIH